MADFNYTYSNHGVPTSQVRMKYGNSKLLKLFNLHIKITKYLSVNLRIILNYIKRGDMVKWKNYINYKFI